MTEQSSEFWGLAILGCLIIFVIVIGHELPIFLSRIYISKVTGSKKSSLWFLAILLSLPLLIVGLAVGLIEKISYGDAIVGQFLAKPFIHSYEKLPR